MEWRVKFVDYPQQWRRQRAELLPVIEDTIARGDLMLELGVPVAPDADPRRFDVYQNYPVTADRRDALAGHLRDDGVETRISWPVPLHRQRGLGLDHWQLPHTERLCRRVLSLPLNPELEDWQVEYVAASIRRFFGGSGLGV
jgi:dTDP-4-amino-4,6-dideoxygalactose transaminase